MRELQSSGSAGEFYTPRAVTDFIAEKINPRICESCADFPCGTVGFLVSWLKALEAKIVTSSDRELYDSSIHGTEKKQCPYILCVTNMLLHDIDSPDIRHGNSLGKNILDFTDQDRFDVIMMNPPYGGSEKLDIMSHFPKDLRSSETADLFMALIMYRLKEGGRAAVILPDGFLFGTDGAVIRMPATVFASYTSITTNILFFDRTGRTRETWFYHLDMPEGYKNFNKTSPIKREHFSPVDEWWQNRRELQDDGETFKSRKYSADEIIAGNFSLDLCGFPNDEKVILTPEKTIKRFMRERERLGGIVDGKIAEIMRLLEVRELKLADDLRRALLQAAIEGSLTGGSRDNWRFVRLGEIGEIIGGGTPDTSKSEYWLHGRIAWITPADMGTLKSKYIAHGARQITEKGLASSSARIMPKGSIIFSSRAL